MAKVLSHEIDVAIGAIRNALDVHDAIEAVTHHLQNIGMVNHTVVLNLASHLNLVDGLLVATGAKNLQDDVFASLVPVLRQIDLGVGSLVDFLSNLVALVDHDGLRFA